MPLRSTGPRGPITGRVRDNRDGLHDHGLAWWATDVSATAFATGPLADEAPFRDDSCATALHDHGVRTRGVRGGTRGDATAFDPNNPFDFFVDDRVREVPFTYPDRLDAELAPSLGPRGPIIGRVCDNRAGLHDQEARVVSDGRECHRVRDRPAADEAAFETTLARRLCTSQCSHSWWDGDATAFDRPAGA